jgi:hypothetical protein
MVIQADEIILRWSIILQVDLTNMTALWDINPVKAEVGSHRDTNQQGQNYETNQELYNLAMQSRGGQGLNHLLHIGL